MDDGIGRIVSALERNNMTHNTVVAFASDVRMI